MYLRNKKTGEVVDWSFVGPTAIKEYEGKDVLLERERYESIEEFISEWEDYSPAEPLIKDEKIRKAVRAWAEAQEMTEVYLASNGYEIYGGIDDWVMQFKGEPFPFADKNKIYTIAELCGEGGE